MERFIIALKECVFKCLNNNNNNVRDYFYFKQYLLQTTIECRIALNCLNLMIELWI